MSYCSYSWSMPSRTNASRTTTEACSSACRNVTASDGRPLRSTSTRRATSSTGKRVCRSVHPTTCCRRVLHDMFKRMHVMATVVYVYVCTAMCNIIMYYNMYYRACVCVGGGRWCVRVFVRMCASNNFYHRKSVLIT